MNTNTPNPDKNQMELALPRRARRNPIPPRHAAEPRARWWFEQMRRAVDRATEWTAAPQLSAGATGSAGVQAAR